VTQDVDPETFYLVGKRLYELAGQMYDAFAVNVVMLGETGAMAGSDDAGTAWATSYDARAREILDAVNDLTLAMENYGGVVIQAGHNHAIAEHNATPGAGAPPERPPEPVSVAGVLTAPPSAGGPGQGLIDNALGLVGQIGVPVPDGDTDKVDKAAQAWDRLATVYQTKTVPEALDVQAGIFSNTSTPEVEYIGKDLGELRDAANAILGACGELAQSCRDYRAALEDLRGQLTGILEDLAIELAATAAIGIAASFVTFGVGAVAATAKTAHTITKFAGIIRTAVTGWKISKSISNGVKKAADVAAIRQRLQRIKNLGRKGKDEEPKPLVAPRSLDEMFAAGAKPNASELERYALSQGWTKTQTPTGPPKYIDENGVVRMTIKQGSPRTPGSEHPHVELRDASGQRIDPFGNPVTRHSPENHTPIEWDW
jgi:hypothetical protein